MNDLPIIYLLILHNPNSLVVCANLHLAHIITAEYCRFVREHRCQLETVGHSCEEEVCVLMVFSL